MTNHQLFDLRERVVAEAPPALLLELLTLIDDYKIDRDRLAARDSFVEHIRLVVLGQR